MTGVQERGKALFIAGQTKDLIQKKSRGDAKTSVFVQWEKRGRETSWISLT